MKTVKLYENDSRLGVFTCTVLSCEETENGFKIMTDKTAFFPEGGGQASDRGFFGETEVTDVQEENGEIYHYVTAPFEPGQTVEGTLDYARRFSMMQNHTGEHIVSGIIHSRFDYNNIGFHLGDDVVTLDVDGKLSDDEIAGIEAEANLAVLKNVPVTVSYPAPEELETLEYRSKLDLKEGVRIVTIGDFDVCACCAPHVTATGEVMAIKLLTHYPHKRGTRIELVCGYRALEELSRLYALNAQIMKLLAVPSDETAAGVIRIQNTAAEQSGEIKRLKTALALAEMKTEKIGSVTAAFLSGAGFDGMTDCLNSLTRENDGVCLVISDGGEECLFALSSSGEDINPVLGVLRSSLHAKGGGRDGFAQGKIPAGADEIRAVLSTEL